MTGDGGIRGGTQLFTDIFIKDGEMISSIIDGEANRGNIIAFITEI